LGNERRSKGLDDRDRRRFYEVLGEKVEQFQ
jgi:hypothetical protein